MDRVRKRDRLKNFGKRVFGGSSEVLKIPQSVATNSSSDPQTGLDSESKTGSGQDLTTETDEQISWDSSAGAQTEHDSPPDTLPSASTTLAPLSNSAGFLHISLLQLTLGWLFLGRLQILRLWKH
jgi:hypothetical protein